MAYTDRWENLERESRPDFAENWEEEWEEEWDEPPRRKAVRRRLRPFNKKIWGEGSVTLPVCFRCMNRHGTGCQNKHCKNNSQPVSFIFHLCSPLRVALLTVSNPHFVHAGTK